MLRKSFSFINTIKWHMLTIFEHRFLFIAAIGINFFSGMITVKQMLNAGASSLPSMQDALFVVYAGPAIGNSNLITVLTWLLNILFFLLLIANLMSEQAITDNFFILLRVSSRKAWLWGILVSILIAAIVYVSLTVICAIAGIGVTLNWAFKEGPFFEEMGLWTYVSTLSFVQVLMLVGITTFSSVVTECFLLTLLTLRTHQIVWSILAVITLSLITWLLGAGEKVYPLQIWLPPTQSIISRHAPFESQLPAFTFSFSFIYNFIVCAMLASAAFLSVKNLDFLGDYNDNK